MELPECVRYLLEKGRKHLVFINKGDTPSNRLKIQGFCEALQNAGATEAPNVLWLDGE